MLQEKSRIVTFKIEPQTLILVDKTAITLGKSRSELIREALRHYIKQVSTPMSDPESKPARKAKTNIALQTSSFR
ncbi:MAG: ribbon-helix-helix protein, CopG family [Desulfurococcales archaeon]|nr:ribbon-helix-helix protein, CopG family [Desulfurococcales archaeon]